MEQITKVPVAIYLVGASAQTLEDTLASGTIMTEINRILGWFNLLMVFFERFNVVIIIVLVNSIDQIVW